MVGGISLIWAIPIDKNLPHRSAQGIDYCTKKIVGQVERDLGVMQFNRDGIRVTSSNENGQVSVRVFFLQNHSIARA